jgi:hypothetical protein
MYFKTTLRFSDLPKFFTHFCQPAWPSSRAPRSSPLSYAAKRWAENSESLSSKTGLASVLQRAKEAIVIYNSYLGD